MPNPPARLFRLFCLCSAIAWSMAAALPARAETVTVFAAASLKESLEAIARPWEAATGHKVVISFAASSALARQIDAGAPADLFISADLDWADYLEKRNLLAPGSRINLLRNSLVLIAPADSKADIKLVPGVKLAPLIKDSRLAMGNPDVVPAGKYGKAALESLNAWNDIKSKVAGAESVRAALALVSRGEAPLGIVYRTDALADKGVRIVDTFPASTHPDIVYPAARMAASKSSAAHTFLNHLASPEAKAVWQRFGFTPAK
jgi:molybdate transport system substrate-binding protein